MSSIDNRIVNMQFNNKGFESGVATTLNSLKKLNESLKMKDASKGLTGISDSLNKVNSTGMSGLSKGVDAVTSKFSALGIMATTALVNITNKAVNAGTALLKSLTIEPVMTGFSEYETKMGAIQTILTNTAHAGTTIDDVNKILSELNTYSDQTIYNFAEMTRNIGTFTAAGVDLETSAAAIKGIANLAAASGSNSNQAATAMYQLSQALAAGKVSLADWNSVVNAGMGGKLFQDSLIRTSEILGTGAEDMIKKYGSFRESLTKGEWLTSEVLTETLKQLSGAYTEADLIAQGFTKSQAAEIVRLAESATAAATEVKTVTQLMDTMKESVQSGWAQTWEYIIGDKDQATKTLTAISEGFQNMIGPSTEARNNMLKFWNEAGGRDDVIKGFTNIFQSIGKGFKSIGEAWREVFPALEGKDLTMLSAKFADFSKKLLMNDETAKKIKDTFKGLFSVLKIGVDAFKSFFSILTSGAGIFGTIGNVALTVTSTIGNLFTKMYEGLKAGNVFENIANTVKKGVSSIGDFLKSCGNGIKEFISQLSSLNFKPIFDLISQVGSGLGKGLEEVFTGVGNAIGKLDLNKVLVALTALAGKDIFKTIKDSILGFKDSLEEFGNIGGSITDILDGVKSALESYQRDLSAGTLIKISTAIAMLAASILVLSSIKPEQMENGLIAMTTLFVELIAAFAILVGVLDGKKLKGLMSVSTTFIALASAILILSAAMKVLSGIPWDGIGKGLIGIAGSMAVLVAATQLMNTKSKGMVRSAEAMVVMAAALVVMAQAVKMFGQLDCMSMIQGLAGVGVALAELGLFMKLTEANRMGVANSAGILIMASALLVFQNAVAKFGNMDIASLIQGLISVGALMVELGVFMKLVSGAGGMLTTAAGMVVLAGAINLMVPPIEALGNLSWGEIARGLTSLAGALTILGVASAVLSGGQLAAVGAGLAVMSAAMLVLGAALNSLGGMSWEQIAKSLVTLAGSLVIFAAAMAAMSTGLAGAAAMAVMSASMALFTPQLIAMANLSWGQIAAGLAMLAGSFTVIGIAGAVLTPLVPALAGLGVAVAALGVACLAAGAGVALFAAGMGTLAAIGAAGGYALAEVLRQLIKLLPEFASALGKSLVEFAKAIGAGMPALAKAMGQCMIGLLEAISDAIPEIIRVGLELLTAFCQVLLDGGPKLIDVAVKMVVALVNGLASNAGKLVEAAVQLIVNVLNALAAKVGELTQAGIDLAIAIINGLADGIRNNTERVNEALRNLAKALLDAFKSVLGINSPSTVMQQCGVDIIVGLINGITNKVGEVVNKMKELATNMINAIKSKVGEFLSAGSELISNLVNGIKSKVSAVAETVRTAVSNAANAVKSKVGEFLSAGKQLIQNLINGVQSSASQIAAKVKSAISSAKSAASGMASSFKSIGSNIISSLASGIASMASTVASKAKTVVQGAIDAAKSALKINSPSKVFMSMGNSVVEGFVKGMDDDAHLVEKPAVSMTRRAMESVSDTISSVSRALNTEMDTELTIKPVMDLSNVEMGTRTIRDMMAENNSFSINADATGAISKSIGNIQNGSGNEQLIQAIKDLKASMTNNGGTTYNINGITYDDGSNVTGAVETLIRAARIERRI